MGFLDGISPWWWIAAAILLAAIEMLTVSTVLIWSAFAAFATALALWLAPGLAPAVQIGLFAVLSIAFTFGGRSLAGRFVRDQSGSSLNRRAEALVGREAEVVSFAVHEGQVTVDGVPWPARMDGSDRKLVAGDRVRIVATDGIVVRVRPIVDPPPGERSAR